MGLGLQLGRTLVFCYEHFASGTRNAGRLALVAFHFSFLSHVCRSVYWSVGNMFVWTVLNNLGTSSFFIRT